MGRVGTILGSNAIGRGGAEIVAVSEENADAVVLRHGGEAYTPPHLIDHEANLRRVADAGCDRVLAIGSVGSLRPELGVGSFVCPDDFIALQLSLTTFDDARGHVAPGFDPRWRGEVLDGWESSGAGAIQDGGVYWHATGPRFETPAEIRLMAAHAHLVGMTLAAECVVAGELGLPYAAVCVVDNMANGIDDRLILTDELEDQRARNAAALGDALDRLLPELEA
ncbi:MAG TPA: MTAP family purine nucleoside phosphorylase [Solirubrobacterales bacterium]|jgi:5'-methylthioadenosine phosphorylase